MTTPNTHFESKTPRKTRCCKGDDPYSWLLIGVILTKRPELARRSLPRARRRESAVGEGSSEALTTTATDFRAGRDPAPHARAYVNL
jgi:hypothetical protein